MSETNGNGQLKVVETKSIFIGRYKSGAAHREVYFESTSIKAAQKTFDRYIVYLHKVNNEYGRSFQAVGYVKPFCEDIEEKMRVHQEMLDKESEKETAIV